MLQGTVGSITSWDGLAWVTNIDSNIRSLKIIIIVYFISFLEINERNLLLDPSKIWESQVKVV